MVVGEMYLTERPEDDERTNEWKANVLRHEVGIVLWLWWNVNMRL